MAVELPSVVVLDVVLLLVVVEAVAACEEARAVVHIAELFDEVPEDEPEVDAVVPLLVPLPAAADAVGVSPPPPPPQPAITDAINVIETTVASVRI
ncbi:hypothetical protein BGC_03460 [Burkholderia sp. 3C]